MLVSFGVFFQRFEAGEAADSDQELLGRLLQPYLTDTGYGFSDLRFSDGNAAIYGVDDLASGFVVNHVSGKEAWAVLAAVAHEGEIVKTCG